MNRKDAQVARLRLAEQPSAADASAVRLGQIVAAGKEAAIWVLVAGTERPVPARLGIAAPQLALEQAVETAQSVVLVLENGDPARPIIIGFIATPQSPAIEPAAQLPVSTPGDHDVAIDADVDSRRIHIRAQDEIVLSCGAASVTLRRNGRVIIRGTHVETHSDGTNRIKGAQVRIN
jgi:hypothetical protein